MLWLCAGSALAAASRHVVLISIDGLRPEFYLDAAWQAPELRSLLKAGTHARQVETVFPSVTYTAHASISTGVRPVRHGIAFNRRFEPAQAQVRWYADAADLRAPPIWEWARAAGLTTAAVSWPTTVGARIDLLVPEQDYFDRDEPLDLFLRSSTPGLFERLGLTPRAEMLKDVTQQDAFFTETAAAIVRRFRPRLLLLHLVETDYRQHRNPLDGEEVRAALRRVDAHVGTVLRALREAGIADLTAVLVAGDHGFAPISGFVFPNAALARAGLRGCPALGEDWRAAVHVAGGAAAVFVNPPGDRAAAVAAEAALRAAAPGHFTLISLEELDRLGAFSGAAAFGLEAAPGYAMSGSCDRGLIHPYEGGAHGYLPARPSMLTGLIAAGAGVRAGIKLDRVRLIDIAPTVARLLGLETPPVEGRVLGEMLE